MYKVFIFVSCYLPDVFFATYSIAEYKLVEAIPDDLKPNLPTIEELEKTLDIPEE